jgi:hypothetical protein
VVEQSFCDGGSMHLDDNYCLIYVFYSYGGNMFI